MKKEIMEKINLIEVRLLIADNYRDLTSAVGKPIVFYPKTGTKLSLEEYSKYLKKWENPLAIYFSDEPTKEELDKEYKEYEESLLPYDSDVRTFEKDGVWYIIEYVGDEDAVDEMMLLTYKFSKEPNEEMYRSAEKLVEESKKCYY